MVDDFCGYFTPGGQVLYVGDADAKWAFFEQAALADLGVIVDQHGKMPATRQGRCPRVRLR
jgi:BsuBI/PstI restriction endonuclease domain